MVLATPQRFVRFIARNLRQGTLRQAVSDRVHRRRARWYLKTPGEATRFLIAAAAAQRLPGRPVTLLLGGDSKFRDGLEAGLDGSVRVARQLSDVPIADQALVGMVLIGSLSSQEQYETGKAVISSDLAHVPLDYVALPSWEQRRSRQWDRLSDWNFVSPMLSKYGTVLETIYAESLTRFRAKTEIRDFLDLAGRLNELDRRGVPGDIAEFGSMEGHSGWLISRTLEVFESDRHLYMFDMFEEFPSETAGIDSLWNNSHYVDFGEVRRKFADRPNTTLVKGDFTQTLAVSDVRQLALAFVDCDSYRATAWLLPQLWHNYLSVSGLVVLEDYGHAELLGNRIATHNFFDHRSEAAVEYSARSGFFTALKLS